MAVFTEVNVKVFLDNEWVDITDDINFTYSGECPNCKKEMNIKQPKNHSEYVPCGVCENCGTIAVIATEQGKKIIRFSEARK